MAKREPAPNEPKSTDSLTALLQHIDILKAKISMLEALLREERAEKERLREKWDE